MVLPWKKVLSVFVALVPAVLATCSDLEITAGLKLVDDESQKVYVSDGKFCPEDAEISMCTPDKAPPECSSALEGQLTAIGRINVTSDDGVQLTDADASFLYGEVTRRKSDQATVHRSVTGCINYFAFSSLEDFRCLAPGTYGALAWTPKLYCWPVTVSGCDDVGSLRDGMELRVCLVTEFRTARQPKDEYYPNGDVELIPLNASSYMSVRSETSFNQTCNNATPKKNAAVTTKMSGIMSVIAISTAVLLL